MSQNFQPGDYLVFQIESGFGLLRILAIDDAGDEGRIFHLSAFEELFLDIESADAALANPASLTVSASHLALTNRAFEATQTARMMNSPITEAENATVAEWRTSGAEASDRSVRLLLGLR